MPNDKDPMDVTVPEDAEAKERAALLARMTPEQRERFELQSDGLDIVPGPAPKP